MLGIGVLGVRQERRNQELRIEHVDAHGGVDHVRMQVRALRRDGLFLEADDPPIRVGFDDAEAARRFLRRNFKRGHGHVGAGIHMLLEHFLVVHLVDVVAGKNDDVARVLAADGINVLVNGVGGSEIPVGGDAHLRRQDFDEFAEAQQLRPALADVPVERKRFVLRQNEDAAEIAVDAVGKRDVDNAVDAAEGHSGLGAVARQRPQPFALPACQQNADRIAHQGHERIFLPRPNCRGRGLWCPAILAGTPESPIQACPRPRLIQGRAWKNKA